MFTLLKNKEQRTKNKEQRTKNKEQRTKNKEQIILFTTNKNLHHPLNLRETKKGYRF
jgi:hypothetical protein